MNPLENLLATDLRRNSRVDFRSFIMTLSFLCFSLVKADPFSAPSNSPLIDQNLNPLKIDSIEVQEEKLSAGQISELKLKIQLEPGFHAYLEQFKLKINSPDNFHLSEIQVRPLVKFRDPLTGKEKQGIEKYAEIISLLDIPQNYSPKTAELQLELTYQACGKDFCLFPKQVQINKTITLNSTTDDGISSLLAKGWLQALIVVFIAGLLTSFTPCIFPMIPITMAVLGTKDRGRTRAQSIIISLTYVLGIALTYSILGVVAAKTGALFGSYLGHPLVVTMIAITFTAMGLSMYGFFEIQLPARWTQQLYSGRIERNLIGAFISGLIAGVVASPCVGPVLISILVYVAQTKDVFTGFVLLFTFAFGLGQIFLVLGTFQSLLHKLPKSGAWMEKVKYIFGTVMICMAIYYVYPVIKNTSVWQKITNTISMRPGSTDEKPKIQGPLWHPYSEDLIVKAKQEGKVVVIDFKADWCLACKELELYTFSDPAVLDFGKDFIWLEFDATSPSPELEVLQKKYGIGGLPFVTFYDKTGKWRKDLTLFGFEKADAFLKRCQGLF